MKLSNINILILRLVIATLFLDLGLDKYHEGWLTNSEHLVKSLNGYYQRAGGAQLSYLDIVAVPYVGIWAKLITIGELAIAVSLILGLLVRMTSAIAIFMIVNLHAANGNLFSLNFFGSPWAALLVASFLILFLSRAGRWAGIDALLAKANTKGALW